MAGGLAIFRFYRRPMAIAGIRYLLLPAFAFSSTSRTRFVATQRALTSAVRLLTAFAVLLIALATSAGRRFPPPFSPVTMRRIAFATLRLIGLSLTFSAMIREPPQPPSAP